MTIGEMIRNKRKEVNMTQQELGKLLNVSSQMIAQYEKDKRKPKIETLRKICTAMNTTIGELGVDIWKYYSAEEFADDFRANLNTALSQVPVQMESMLKRSVNNAIKNIRLSGERAQQHAHEIVDSDWKCVLLLHDYEKLNTTGRNEAQKRINELTEMKKYTESKEEM